MPYTKHKIYGMIFNLFKIFPVKDNRISFIIDSKQSFKGNFNYIKEELQKRGDFEFNIFYKDKFSFNSFKKLATSKYVFLNDNFFPMAFMKFNKDSVVCQLWHAPGAFKKFGGSSSTDEERLMLQKISENITYLITTSVDVEDYYAEAFQIDKSKIKALGIPRCDYFFENHDADSLKEDFKSEYNIPDDKKIILYAPTFRNKEKYNDVFNFLNLKEFNKVLGDEYVLLLRLHPKISKFSSDSISSDEFYIDCSDYEDEQKLLLISDMLITDYSSIMIDFSLLNKPILFFTYDFDDYLNNERGFYFDFKNTVPGPVLETSSDLIDYIKKGDFQYDGLSEFSRTQFNEIDGNASKRIVDFILNGGV